MYVGVPQKYTSTNELNHDGCKFSGAQTDTTKDKQTDPNDTRSLWNMLRNTSNALVTQ